MKIQLQLQELLQENEQAIAAYSTLMGQGKLQIDCTGVEAIALEQLALLLSGIPAEWDFVELAQVFDPETMTEDFATQFNQAIDQRLGRTSTPSPQRSTPQTPGILDIFNLRNEVVSDYRRYIESFLKIREPRVDQFVHQELEKGQLWTDPLLQLNPFYKSGSTVTQLVQQGVLHPDCTQYFSKDGNPFQFRYHQEQAFLAAQRQEHYVLTTGTGSGKSMTYVVPIFDICCDTLKLEA